MPICLPEKQKTSSSNEVISLVESENTNNGTRSQSTASNISDEAKESFLRSITKSEAREAVGKLMADKGCSFYMVEFKDLVNKKLTSKVYDQYHALCHINRKTCYGWAISEYVSTGACTVSNGCQRFDSEQGTTNMLRHRKSHEKFSGQVQHPRQLGSKSKQEICTAVAKVIVEDLLPYAFDEGNGMKKFINAVFRAGQSVGVRDNIITDDLEPSAKTVHKNVSLLVMEQRLSFANHVNAVLEHGSVMSIDRVTLKVQEKHFYDLTRHYFKFDPPNAFQKCQATLENKTLVLAKSHGDNSASGIRLLMNSQLMSKYNFDFNFLARLFTLVTDWVAVMPNIVGASISRNISPLNEKWLGCIVHQLNTSMKFALKLCETDPFLDRVNQDLVRVKSSVRIFKHSKWNHELGDGYHLLQEVETRLGTTHTVADRFVKSGSAAFALIDEKGSEAAQKEKHAILQGTDPGGQYVSFPAIEAIVDAFGIVVYVQKLLEASKSPTIHLVLPMLRKCYDVMTRENCNRRGC